MRMNAAAPQGKAPARVDMDTTVPAVLPCIRTTAPLLIIVGAVREEILVVVVKVDSCCILLLLLAPPPNNTARAAAAAEAFPCMNCNNAEDADCLKLACRKR